MRQKMAMAEMAKVTQMLTLNENDIELCQGIDSTSIAQTGTETVWRFNDNRTEAIVTADPLRGELTGDEFSQ